MSYKNQTIENILIEWAYRVDSGIPNPKNKEHIWVLSEVLSDLGLSEIKNELIENLLNEEDKSEEERLKPIFKNPILNKIVTYQNKDGKEQKGLVGNLLSNPKDNPGRIAAEKLLPAEGTPQRDKINSELGGDDKSQQPQSGPSAGGEQPQQQMGTALKADTPSGKSYIDSLPDGDPAKPKQKEEDKYKPQPNGYVGPKNKSLTKGSPIESEEYQRELEPSDEEFAKRNSKDENPTPPPPIRLETLIPNPKFPKRYIKVLERMMNSRVSSRTAKWSHFSDIEGGQGKISAQAGELLTLMGATMSDEEFTNLTNQLLKHERELLDNHPEIFKKKEKGKLVDNPGSRILDRSWVVAARQSRKVILAQVEKQYGKGTKMVAGAWDSKKEVEAMGLQNYKENKGYSTDVYFKVETPNGEELLHEVSLKKSKNVNFMNCGAGKFSDWDDNLPDEINQNVYRDKQRERNLKFVNDNKQQVEDFINSDKGKSIQSELKQKGLTFEQALEGNSRDKQKILYLIAKGMSEMGNDSAKQVIDETQRAHSEFKEKQLRQYLQMIK